MIRVVTTMSQLDIQRYIIRLLSLCKEILRVLGMTVSKEKKKKKQILHQKLWDGAEFLPF